MNLFFIPGFGVSRRAAAANIKICIRSGVEAAIKHNKTVWQSVMDQKARVKKHPASVSRKVGHVLASDLQPDMCAVRYLACVPNFSLSRPTINLLVSFTALFLPLQTNDGAK